MFLSQYIIAQYGNILQFDLLIFVNYISKYITNNEKDLKAGNVNFSIY